MFKFTVEEEVILNRPVEEVFQFIADAENDVKWCPSVKRIKQISGNGPGPDAVYEMHHTPGGMKFDATVQIVAFEPNRAMEWVMTDGGHVIRGTYRLTPAGDGTRLRQRSEITFTGWLRLPGLFMKGFIARDVKKELGKQFSQLKVLLENRPVGVED